VAVNPSGAAVVAWRDTRRGNYSVFGQLFNPLGNRVGGNFSVSDRTTGTGFPSCVPHVALNKTGDFIIGWAFNETLYYQLYRADGNRIGTNMSLSSTDWWSVPALCDDRSFWLTWTWQDSVWLEKFDSLSQPLIGPELVAARPYAWTSVTAIAPDGNVWVVWQDRRAGGGARDVFARRYSPDGSPLGIDFRVNDDNAMCDHGFAWLAFGPDRAYIAYSDFRVYGAINLEAQEFDLDGVPVGPNYVVNHPAYPYDPAWNWGAVAACSHYVAYTWLDNRNARSWDAYFQLRTAEVNHDDSTGNNSPTMLLPSVLRIGHSLHLLLPESLQVTHVRLINESGATIKALLDGPARGDIPLSTGQLRPGVYFISVEHAARRSVCKLVLLN
jgi:hypothetical protein